MWRELVAGAGSGAELRPPVRETHIGEAERRLGHPLPSDLVELLLETDGVVDSHGTSVVWSTGRITADNLAFRRSPSFARLYRPFGSLLFFGDNGGGDQFAFAVGRGGDGVFVWDHETDERCVVASSLEEYVRRSLEADAGDWYRQ
ncbi:hypothetical protein GCM10010420_44870 [Streptomyces glaucosporus]|uniref:Knr4/Smi1-like domain-containing protein n=1 Tax=Streptomyces glaucosporus TaxID=284044 RepID=A0ABN3IRY0_9ACTN